MKNIYGSIPPVSARYNDFYPHYLIDIPTSDSGPVLVYVGKSLRGRSLEYLGKPPHEVGAELYFYSLGSPLRGALALWSREL